MKSNGTFAAQIEDEIHSRIIPHLNGLADHNYPFTDIDGLFKARLQGTIGVSRMLVKLDQAARKFSRVEYDAILFIAARDLNERLEQYLEFAQGRESRPKPKPQMAAQVA